MASMFKMVFLEIPNVPKGTVFAEQVTYTHAKFGSLKRRAKMAHGSSMLESM